uniref:SFRICE_017606 n=1 Tax=Spodoptera frugiperda TaxID=7108 RepID=A0A2H1W200_SPOFR
MTKELSAKRKVDKCRDTHPRVTRGEGVRGDQWQRGAVLPAPAIGRRPGVRAPPRPRGSSLLN